MMGKGEEEEERRKENEHGRKRDVTKTESAQL
jgi:hypothetical protein